MAVRWHSFRRVDLARFSRTGWVWTRAPLDESFTAATTPSDKRTCRRAVRKKRTRRSVERDKEEEGRSRGGKKIVEGPGG